MSSLAFVTHPSVRIKGTENSYTPTQCLDERCPVKAPHLHCPFCVKTDAYQDPVILKAHYRVKHVDKGIEFAGLKILRCCDQCDIIGIIKGEKRFKGAHWHCYRCRNGFNRRDEAIKHYKTHFRNPQTTFQIQITQDLNSPPEVRPQDEHSASQDAFASIENPVQEIIHPSLSQTAISLAEQNVITSGAVSNRHGGSVQKIKVKHELLGKDESGDRVDEETIMIIQGDQLESAFASHIINSGELTALNKANIDPNLSWEIRFRMEEDEKNIYKLKAEEYKAQVDLLQQRVSDLESQLAEQCQLKLHELLDALSSGGVNKHGFGQQVTKILEQCQLNQCHGSVTVIEDDSQSQVPLQDQLEAGDSIIQDLESHPNSLTDQLETNGSMTHHMDSNTSVAHHCEIPEGFHVICTSEGHVVVTRNTDAIATITETRRAISPQNTNSSNSTATGSLASERELPLFTLVLNPGGKTDVTEATVVLPEVTTENENPELITESDIPREEQADLADEGTGQECLMEVVAATDGSASPGTDASVCSSASLEKQSQNLFVESSLVHDSVVKINKAERPSKEIEEHQMLQPAVKRVRIT